MGALTNAERVSCRYHLGYLLSLTVVSLTPFHPVKYPVLTQLEQQMDGLTDDDALVRVRQTLATLESLNAKISAATCTLGIESVDKTTFHPLREQGRLVTDSLRKEYEHWVSVLADALGVRPFFDSVRRRGRFVRFK